MADHTKIQWADATWNPMTGCTPASEGCANCYARRIAGRHLSVTRCPDCIGGFVMLAPTFHPDRLDIPLHWRKPRRIFVCSMSDLFHEAFTDEQRRKVFDTMDMSGWHTFMVLTKRPGRMHRFVLDYGERWTARNGTMLPNVMLGTTVENQQRADERIPILLDTPAAVRFVSVEPMLGPVDLEACGALGTIDWIICGGETGPGARPMRPEWALDLWQQCKAAGTPFFFKQRGAWANHRFPLSPGGPFAAVATTREYPEAT